MGCNRLFCLMRPSLFSDQDSTIPYNNTISVSFTHSWAGIDECRDDTEHLIIGVSQLPSLPVDRKISSLASHPPRIDGPRVPKPNLPEPILPQPTTYHFYQQVPGYDLPELKLDLLFDSIEIGQAKNLLQFQSCCQRKQQSKQNLKTRMSRVKLEIEAVILLCHWKVQNLLDPPKTKTSDATDSLRISYQLWK
ncbi:Uncharacterized protein TCM_011865 [Theobroma cacao]|uniref:Uncharacterized protein n=1 Tax=Theobroma cacao TaxID=3641 RepID=A0A061EB36_THECC|nr:Uncharacterized protein TCM_011865 [Theobroma cacao]